MSCDDLSIVCVTKGEVECLPTLSRLINDAYQLGAECVIGVDGPGGTISGLDRFGIPEAFHYVEVQSQGYIESVLDKVISETTRPYVLRLDDDESMSDRMLQWLKDGRYHESDHWKFCRAHLFQNGQTVIMNPPLWPDHQTRLSTCEKSFGRTSIHCGSPFGGGQLAPVSILHHKFVIRNQEQRAEILARYEEISRGSGSNFWQFSIPELIVEPARELLYLGELLQAQTVESAVDLGFAIGMHQHQEEIESFTSWLYSRFGGEIHNVLEIGTLHGGTATLWHEISTGSVITIDLPGGRFGGADHNYDVQKCRVRSAQLCARFPRIMGLLGNSHEDACRDLAQVLLGQGQKIDLLFIDGDHTYEGVKRDYELYRDLVREGGVIAFHDIMDTELHRVAGCEVSKLWAELQGEKYEFTINDPWGGIGALIKKEEES